MGLGALSWEEVGGLEGLQGASDLTSSIRVLKVTPLILALRHLLPVQIGDKFGESLGGSQAPPSFWETPGLPRKFPELPRKFFGDFPGRSLTVELNSNQRFPGSFPDFPGSSPDFPGSSPDFAGGQPLSLRSLTPSLDSQKLSLRPEADLQNRRCPRENCAKLVRRAVPTSPRNFVRKMRGGIKKCAGIVRNLCGG